MWIREMHFKDERKHSIEYQFVCQSCNQPSGPIRREIVALHERKYPGHFALTPQDEAALPVIMESKFVNVLALTWLAFERGEYNFGPGTSYTKESLADYNVNVWQAVCPHCGTKQKWQPKKKLFAKPVPVDPRYLPQINWRWEVLDEKVLARVEWIKRERSQYLTDKKTYALSGSIIGLQHSMINDDEGVWRYVVPGLHLEFVKDLMDNDGPPYYIINPTSLDYDVSLPKKNKPEFNKGESCYGFVSHQDGNPVVRWAIGRDGVVTRTCITPV